MMRDEIMLYRNNNLSYQCMMLFIICNTIFSILSLKKMSIDYLIGFFIIMVIFITLISFLAAVKLRIYSITWGYISILLGVSQFSQLLFTKEIEGIALLKGLLILGIISAIVGGIITIIKGKKRGAYIAKNNING